MCDKKTEQRVVIKFLVKRGVSSAEIMKQLTNVYKDDCLKKTAVYEWAKRFREGRESVEDDSREGAPSTSRTAQNVDRLRVRVLGDRRVSLRMLEDELGINKETIRQMLHEDLGMRKLCAKMVPKVLTVEQKELRLSIYPPYSPDLAPSDFHLFPQLKSYLKGNRYDGVEEVQRVTTRVLRDLSSGGFRGCFQSWIQRWRRCIELEGDYCEGL
nr:unnamed protein product [Callosobruchus chinensis]